MPNIVASKAKRLAEYQAKVLELQAQVERDRARVLAHLHEEYGFASVAELIKAIRAAAGNRRGRPAKAGKGHRKYARISAELRQKIKAALRSGQTGAAVAAEFGVSLPAVYLIKKASGMVKPRRAPRAKKPIKAKKAAKVVKPEPAEKPATTK